MLGIPLKDDDLLFSTPDGKLLRPNTVSRAWAMLAARAGLKGYQASRRKAYPRQFDA
jgi:hypothetical protein